MKVKIKPAFAEENQKALTALGIDIEKSRTLFLTNARHRLV